MKRLLLYLLVLALYLPAISESLQFPEMTNEMHPWTRWWWHGSAVDSSRVSELLKEYARVGIGGVEITSIYGAKGYEEDFIPYLSETYLDMLEHAARQGKALDMGIDIPPGSGWRCGGLGLDIEFADATVVIEEYTVNPGETFDKQFSSPPQAVMAFSPQQNFINLLARVRNNRLTWSPETESWTIYVVSQKWSGARVKRAAPGGEGYSFNPYSLESTEHMLEPFTAAFSEFPRSLIRGIFHDSFEYSGNWYSEFLEEFKKRRGYELTKFLPELTGKGNPDRVRRVKCDYRETISELVLENFLVPLQNWSHDHGWLLRNQSHGSPANLLDLYGRVDIPETEIFRFDRNPQVLKFASSPANLLGKPLVSAESFTWQDEHFTVTLDTMKRSADLLFSTGINHIFYHGTAYSPADADWPGWVFYASSQINPQNPIWQDLDAFNTYIARCQSLLQTSDPDNDVLIYWPVYDVWADSEGLNKKLAVHHPQWITENPAGAVVRTLAAAGIQYDFISDAQLQKASVQDSLIHFPGATYKALVIPKCEYMPVPTLQTAIDLARQGAAVVVDTDWPQNVPGLANWQQRQKMMSEMLVELDQFRSNPTSHGRIRKTEDVIQALSDVGVDGESIAQFPKVLWLRKRTPSGRLYFLSNHSDERIDQWIDLNDSLTSAALFDPMSGRIGVAQTSGQQQVYLQLEPGATLFVKTSSHTVQGEPWPYVKRTGEAVPLAGPWTLTFVQGGPALPEPTQIQHPTFWTELQLDNAERFSGTARYSTRFDAPDIDHSTFLLDLGSVAESAEIHVNGEKIATFFSPPFQTRLPKLEATNNLLEIYVTNVAANRIRDLDRRGIEWQIFYDINFVNIEYEPFDASDWPVWESGLQGPVTLIPIEMEAQP